MSQKKSRAPQRVRNELRFRHLTVASKTRVAGVFWRIVFTGADLAGFHSPSFDDHIKVFFPSGPGCDVALPQLSEEGIVWPEGVRPAARDYTRYAELQAQRVHLLAFTDAAIGRDYLGEMEGVTVHWLGSNRMAATTPAQLTAELGAIDFTGDDYFVWLTGEGNAVKQLSDYFTQQRGADTDFVRAVAYWHQKSSEK